VPDEEIERLRSLLIHADKRERVTTSPVQGSSPTSYVAAADEIERLRLLLAHAHDPETIGPFRRFVLEMGKSLAFPIKQPKPQSGKNKDAA